MEEARFEQSFVNTYMFCKHIRTYVETSATSAINKLHFFKLHFNCTATLLFRSYKEAKIKQQYYATGRQCQREQEVLQVHVRITDRSALAPPEESKSRRYPSTMRYGSCAALQYDLRNQGLQVF